MANDYFKFKQFTINQDKSAFKVGTDGVLLGASVSLNGAGRILEIGSGTGLVALMIAQRCDAQIVTIEPDDDSWLQCCENVSNSKWSSRIKCEHSSLQDYHDDSGFDLIVTNPPFFSDSVRNPDPRKSAARHNDQLTNDQLLSGVSKLLADEGSLQLIMPYVEGNIFIAEAANYSLYCNSILKIRPLPTSEVRRLIMTFSRQRIKPQEKFLTIEHGGRHQFTDEYVNLTKDFYLKF